MTLEGMIRDAAGVAAVRTVDVDGDDYPAAKQKLVALVSEGSKLLWLRRQ